MDLIEYVEGHTERGACTCGRCFDAPADPQSHQPVGHTADLMFFQVKALNEPKADELKALIQAHQPAFVEIDLFDGQEHNYMQVGAWIGDQGYALQLMGLGSLLGLWNLITPYLLGDLPKDLVDLMVGMGFVAIQAPK
jgi:hypothetical protein